MTLKLSIFFKRLAIDKLTQKHKSISLENKMKELRVLGKKIVK
jgi:hypothetical protein